MAVLVDGSMPSSSDGRGGLRYFSPETGPEGTVVEMPDPTRRALVFAWWAGDAVVVLSSACPRWEGNPSGPAFDADSPGWLAQGCGASSLDLWKWEKGSDSWTEVVRGVVDAPDGFTVSEPTGGKIVVTLPPDRERQGDGVVDPPTMYLVDGHEGALTPLPDVPMGQQSSDVDPCVLADGRVVVGVDTLGATDDFSGIGGVVTAEHPLRAVVYVLDDWVWRVLDVPYEASWAVGCDAEAGLVLRGEDSIALVREAREGSAPEVVVLPEGHLVEAWLGGIVTMDRGASLDADRTPVTVNLLSEGEWRPIANSDLIHAVRIVDGRLVALQEPVQAAELPQWAVHT